MYKTRDVVDTSLQGYVNVSYHLLVKAFGEPHYVGEPGSGDKTDAEWAFKVGNDVFTIYNYKDGKSYLGEEGTPVTHITEWHIGGRNKSVVSTVQNILKNA